MSDYYSCPEKYQPLGSYKGIRNAPTRLNIDIKKLFLSDANVYYLVHTIYVTNKQNGGTEIFDYINDKVENILLHEFLKTINIYEYQTVDFQATGNKNWVEILKTVNNDFIKYVNHKLIVWNRFVPTRMSLTVGERGKRREKKMYELTPDDIGTIDYWRKQEVQVKNDIFRYSNKIPVWQTSMHTRRYDLSNEGFKHKEPDRASIENPVYNTYDMTAIHKTIDKWSKEDWFGVY